MVAWVSPLIVVWVSPSSLSGCLRCLGVSLIVVWASPLPGPLPFTVATLRGWGPVYLIMRRFLSSMALLPILNNIQLAMKTFKNLHTIRHSKEAAAALSGGLRSQTARYRVQRPKNTTRPYEVKEEQWENWCAGLRGNTDGAWVTEDKLCLFLNQEVINRERYEARKPKRKWRWKDGEREKKRRRREEEALDDLLNETVRCAVVNSYVSAIGELYARQSKEKALPPLRGAKLLGMLDSLGRDEDRIRRVNFIDRGLFAITDGCNIVTGGCDVKGLRKAISRCWVSESFLRTSAEYLLGRWSIMFAAFLTGSF
jgi:hypothetical protein